LSAFEKQVLGHYLAGEKQSEIAQNLDRDVKSIDNTLQRIKSKLK
jgi:RNA polymerase sporulation-specific sigma factor